MTTQNRVDRLNSITGIITDPNRAIDFHRLVVVTAIETNCATCQDHVKQ